MKVYTVVAVHVDLESHTTATLGVYTRQEMANACGEAYASRMKATAAKPRSGMPMKDDLYEAWKQEGVDMHNAQTFSSFRTQEFELDG